MEIENYKLQHSVESQHWWYICRREMLKRYILSFGLRSDAKVLDVGTSTGTNMRLFEEMDIFKGIGLDLSKDALMLCKSKGFMPLLQGNLLELPFEERSFDALLATDIYEHIEDDERAISECYRVLKPGAPILVAVPTFPVLWGLQDEVSHHCRRYVLKSLVQKMQDVGFEIDHDYHYNYLLFLPILLARWVLKWTKPKIHSEAEVNTYWLNKILEVLFKWDIKTAKLLRPPFGVSGFILARRPL